MSDPIIENNKPAHSTGTVELDGLGYRAKVMHRGKIVADAWFDSQEEAEQFKRVEILKERSASR